MRTIYRIDSAAALWAATLMSLVAACSGSDSSRATGPETRQVARVIIQPGHDTILVGQSLEYLAVALDAAGQPVPGVSFSWMSTQPHVAPVMAGTPTDSANSTGDSVGVTKIVAIANGVRSDSATLVVMPTTGTVRVDSNSFLINCKGIHQLVHGWVLEVRFSYSHTAAGVDTAHENVQASFLAQHDGDVTVRLNQVIGDPVFGYWGDDRSATSVSGRLTVVSQSQWAAPLDFLSEYWSGDGPALGDPKNGAALVTIDTLRGKCAYSFSLYGVGVMATEPGGLQMLFSPGQLMSNEFSMIPAASSADTALTFIGSGEFGAYHLSAVQPIGVDRPVDGWYLLEDQSTLWMYLAGLVHDDEFGTAKVSWRLTAIP